LPQFDYTSGISTKFQRLSFRVSGDLAATPSVNLLIPTLLLDKMTGGQNTGILFGIWLAELGVPVRIISTDAGKDVDGDELVAHLERLSGLKPLPAELSLWDGSDRSVVTDIGVNDLFVATAWWTAQMAKYAIQDTVHDRFFYLIQDYETLLHQASTDYALALETYSLPHIPVVNTRVLLQHYIDTKTGLFADPDFAKSALYFEPAVDRALFYPVPEKPDGKRTLLFYARPGFAPRNLFEFGYAALRKLVNEQSISTDKWRFLAMGEKIDPYDLGRGVTLEPLPWQDLQVYAKTIREADVLLSLMLSPHPSYPPLEMAAAGRTTVTNAFGAKTAAFFASVSPEIVCAAATIEDIASKLQVAMQQAEMRNDMPVDRLSFPSTWRESLTPVYPKVMSIINRMWQR